MIKGFHFIVVMIFILISCQKDFIEPTSKSKLSFLVGDGNGSPLKALQLKNGNTAVIGKKGLKGYVSISSPDYKEIWYDEFTMADNVAYFEIIEMSGGELIILGQFLKGSIIYPLIIKFESSGTSSILMDDDTNNFYIFDISSLPNNNILLVGLEEEGQRTSALMIELDIMGNEIGRTNYKAPKAFFTNAYSSCIDATGRCFIFGGYAEGVSGHVLSNNSPAYGLKWFVYEYDLISHKILQSTDIIYSSPAKTI